MTKLPEGWKEYSPHILYPQSTRFFQKRIYDKGEENRISLQIVEFDSPESWGKSDTIYETDMQIPCHMLSIKHTVNLKVFTYTKLDFTKMEKDALLLLEKLEIK